jgi:hypothetical protein
MDKDFGFIRLPKGIEMRKPYASELKYFKKNANVAGMATEDNRVILNPYSNLNPDQYQSVAVNEASRIMMRQPEFKPDFELTNQQKSFLDTTTYRNATEDERRATIAARILSGDSSAGVATSEQNMFVDRLKNAFQANQ